MTTWGSGISTDNYNHDHPLYFYILRKGVSSPDQTPTIGLLPNNSNIFIKIYSSNQKVETMISNKKLENGKIYSICVSLGFDLNESLTEMSLYIDGILDSQISLPGTPIQNDGNFFIGKYELIKGTEIPIEIPNIILYLLKMKGITSPV